MIIKNDPHVARYKMDKTICIAIYITPEVYIEEND